jgi:hypothetical protein
VLIFAEYYTKLVVESAKDQIQFDDTLDVRDDNDDDAVVKEDETESESEEGEEVVGDGKKKPAKEAKKDARDSKDDDTDDNDDEEDDDDDDDDNRKARSPYKEGPKTSETVKTGDADADTMQAAGAEQTNWTSISSSSKILCCTHCRLIVHVIILLPNHVIHNALFFQVLCLDWWRWLLWW